MVERTLGVSFAVMLLAVPAGARSPAPGVSAAENARREAEADAKFEAIMQQNVIQLDQVQSAGRHRRAMPASPMPTPSPSASQGEVVVGLDRYQRLRDQAQALAEAEDTDRGPPVVLGGASYEGRAEGGVLALRMRLNVTLSGEDQWKLVPLVGDSVVVVRALKNGRPISLSRQNGYHVWVTQHSGEASLDLDIRVPSQGRRGSIEYDFKIAKTPTTEFSCTFPQPDLEPRLFAEVRSEVRNVGGGTSFRATLRPTTRIYMVGFRDVGDDTSRKAKIYAESLNLLSVDEGALDLFTVVRYSILYAGTKSFSILLPPEVKLVSAEGEGAFRYTQEAHPQGTLLKGETAFPIRNAYEISLRLRREIDKEGASFEAFRPKPQEVERDSGWIGVEVTGKLQLEQLEVQNATALDMRQLPPEMLESAVSPILRAYRYHSDKAKIGLQITRLPEKEPATASVDNVRAFTTISTEGDVLTEMRISLRNRLRHHLSLRLPEGMEVRSTLLDGAPAKPSRDGDGALMLPLKRSSGDEPFTLQVTLQSKVSGLGWLGYRAIELPSVDLPVSSAAWTIYLPARNTYTAVEGDIEQQRLWGHGQWHRPVGGPPAAFPAAIAGAPAGGGADLGTMAAEHGAMPVRIALPKTGRRVDYRRYWLNADRPASVYFFFVRSWLLGPLALLSFLIVLAGATLLVDRFFAPSLLPARAHALDLRGVVVGWVIAAAVVAKLWGVGVVVFALILGMGAATALRLGRLRIAMLGWWGILRERWAARSAPEEGKEGEKKKKTSAWIVLWRLSIAAAMFVFAMILLAMLPELLSVLATPLGG